MRVITFIILLAVCPATALAGLTEARIKQVALSPPSGARVPTALMFRDLDGHNVSLGEAIAGRPTLLLPADFTCKQICGPALSIATTALGETGLEPGRDYSLVVVGIDAKDSIDDARRFTSGQVGGPGVSVLSGSDAAIQALLAGPGYRLPPAPPNGAIPHPSPFGTPPRGGKVPPLPASLALQSTDL